MDLRSALGRRWVRLALRRPWPAALVVGVAVGWGVAHAEPCSIKWRGGGCALRLPYDQTWTGGVLWGCLSAAATVVVLLVLRRVAVNGGVDSAPDTRDSAVSRPRSEAGADADDEAAPGPSTRD